MGGFDFDCEDFDEEKMTCTNPDCENHDEKHEGNCNLMWTKEDGKALYDNYARRKATNTTTNTEENQPPSQEGE